MKTTPKPRAFSSQVISARGKCDYHFDSGDPIVDTAIDLYDDNSCASELKRYAKWLAAAAKWVEASK